MSEQTQEHDVLAHEWDQRYGEDQLWSGHPNEQLVVEVSDMAPGTALDVGCGEGADAIWLSARGWRVTGIDVSTKALDRASRAATAAGAAVEWRPVALGDLTAADAAAYDLVIAFHPAILRGDGAIVETLLGVVATGGTLLVVHDAVDRQHAPVRGFDPDDYVGHDDLVAAFADREGWSVEVVEDRARTAPEGLGAHHHTDRVLRARRT